MFWGAGSALGTFIGLIVMLLLVAKWSKKEPEAKNSAQKTTTIKTKNGWSITIKTK